MPLPADIPSEETAPDFSVGAISGDAEHLADIQISTDDQASDVNLRFFVDGVQRTVPVCLIHVNDLRLPVFIAHLITGVMERINGRLHPYLMREAIVLYFPFDVLRSISPTKAGLTDPPLLKLDYRGEIYTKIRSFHRPKEATFWTDISVKLSQRPKEELNLTPSDLSAIGFVRRSARTRSQVLLRIMELGAIYELIVQNILGDKDFIVIDGPVFLPFKYCGLASRDLAVLMDSLGEVVGSRDRLFKFTHNLIGIVKSVEVIPTRGLTAAFAITGKTIVIPVYLFSTTVKGATDEVSQNTLACFLWLRREISQEKSPIWAPSSELTRIDIPFPAVLNLEEWALGDCRPDLSIGSPKRCHVEAVIKSIIAERWPLPETTPHRMLTELYPIAEVERWLKAHLMLESELRRLVGV